MAEQGIRQFLDIGTGIPTQGNTHEIVQSIAPESRVAYVDNDPIVMAHARALLRSTPEGRTSYIEADLRKPDTILGHPDVLAVIDFARPVAVVIVGTLMFINDTEDPVGLVKRFTSVVPRGSYLAISHVTADFDPEGMAASARAYNTGPIPFTPRTATEIVHFFEGFDLVEPGLVAVSDWRSDQPAPADRSPGAYGAVGHKT
jgi:hypothetical protein